MPQSKQLVSKYTQNTQNEPKASIYVEKLEKIW